MTSTTKTQAISPPPESALAPIYGDASLADAFSIALPPGATKDIMRLAEATLSHPAEWTRGLMHVRDSVMARFGVKTSKGIRDAGKTDDREYLDFFPVLSRSSSEVIVGEDDRHLDFRASILLREKGVGDLDMLISTTVVHCHNRLGHLYLAAIHPFHVRIVRAYLRNAAKRGWPGKES